MSSSNDNLVLHLKLDKIKDNKIIDSLSQTQYDINGDLKIVLDETFGSCLTFDGSDDWVNIANPPSLDSNSFTLAAWIRTKTSNLRMQFISYGNNTADQHGAWFFVNPQGKVQFDLSGQVGPSSDKIVNDGDWHHVAVVIDNKSAQIYADGEASGAPHQMTPQVSNEKATIGNLDKFGNLDQNEYWFNGKIANVRIYNKALSPEEIQRDMKDDLRTIASFNKTLPLDFNLYEGEDKEPIIFIKNGTKGQELILEIVNNSGQRITLPPSKSGAVTKDNYHFELRFRPDTLCPDSLQQLALAENNDWSMSSPVSQADGMVSLYFLKPNNQPQPLNAEDETVTLTDEPVTLTLQNINGAAAGGARTTRVELMCPKFTYQQEPFNNYYREKSLSIVSHRGKKNIPLHVGFVGFNRILNDGTTQNTLTLRITNVLKDKSIPFNPDNKGDLASKFKIYFDVDSDWALGTSSQVENIVIEGKDWSPKEHPEEDWKIVKEKEGEIPIWRITHQNEQSGLAPGQVVQLTVSRIISSRPFGNTNLYLRYENISGYWDGTFICTIEKSPIFYDNNGNVGIGTTDTGENKLKVEGDTAITGKLSVTDTSTLTGKIGIGTAPGSEQLKIQGDTAIAGYLSVTGNGATINNVFLGDVGYGTGWAGFSHINNVNQNSYAFLQNDSGIITLINKKSGGGFIGFRVDNKDKMVILDNGNVGIGTEKPTNSLSVVGNADFSNVVRAYSFEPTNPYRHRMYPEKPEVYQNIFEAKSNNKISKLGSPDYNDTDFNENNPFHYRPIIRYGSNNQEDKDGAQVIIPEGFNTVWIRVLGERWSSVKAYFLDGNNEDLGNWAGGFRDGNCYCPDGSLSDSHANVHNWLPIPAGRAGKLALISKSNTNAGFVLSGLAFSKNPWAHAAQSAAAYAWASNGGDQTSGLESWNSDVLTRIDPHKTWTLKVPVVPSHRDKLLYLIEHNNNCNGCMHTSISVNQKQIERFMSTYDNPFSRHWNSKIYNRYIAARIPANLIGPNARYLEVKIDMSKQELPINFREIGTHDLDIPTDQ